MSVPMNYVEADVPEGMTLAEYRRRRRPARPRRRSLLALLRLRALNRNR